MKKNVIEIVKDAILIDGKFNMYELPDIVVNWPLVRDLDNGYEEDDVPYDGEENEEDGFEDLDVESWEILSIDENQMTMCAGGDWQQPQIFTLEWYEHNLLKVVSKTNGYEDGLSNEEILKIFSK